MWDLNLILGENGDILQYDAKQKKKASLGVKQLNRPFCNYFSFGLDARSGLGFDKLRTGTACCNKAMYGWVGVKKLLCCCSSGHMSKTAKVKDLIQCVMSTNSEGNEHVLFATDKDFQAERYLKGNPISLVFTNLNSYMGGQTDLWLTGRGKDLGLVDTKGDPIKPEQMNIVDQTQHNDDKIEISILDSFFHMAGGKGRRIAQEKGPVNIIFKQASNVTYVQADGEYYKAINLQAITVKLHERIGRIRILKNVFD